MKTKTAAKVAKVAKVAPVKVAKVATVYAYAMLLGECLSGAFGPIVRQFYVSALQYHGKQGTTFPRGRIATIALMSDVDARAFIDARRDTSIPAGSLPAQRVFDQMMIEAEAQRKAKA